MINDYSFTIMVSPAPEDKWLQRYHYGESSCRGQVNTALPLWWIQPQRTSNYSFTITVSPAQEKKWLQLYHHGESSPIGQVTTALPLWWVQPPTINDYHGESSCRGQVTTALPSWWVQPQMINNYSFTIMVSPAAEDKWLQLYHYGESNPRG